MSDQGGALAPSQPSQLLARLGGTVAASSELVAMHYVPPTFEALTAFAELMAKSRAAVPIHLRENHGACLSVCMIAYANRINPWMLAQDTYLVNDKAVIAYGAKSCAALVNVAPSIVEKPQLEFEGEGENLKVTVTGHTAGRSKPSTITYHLRSITVRNSPLWKAQPVQQFGYWALRAWARLFAPEVLLGIVTPDDYGVDIDAEPGEYRIIEQERAAEDQRPIATAAAEAVAAASPPPRPRRSQPRPKTNSPAPAAGLKEELAAKMAAAKEAATAAPATGATETAPEGEKPTTGHAAQADGPAEVWPMIDEDGVIHELKSKGLFVTTLAETYTRVQADPDKVLDLWEANADMVERLGSARSLISTFENAVNALLDAEDGETNGSAEAEGDDGSGGPVELTGDPTDAAAEQQDLTMPAEKSPAQLAADAKADAEKRGPIPTTITYGDGRVEEMPSDPAFLMGLKAEYEKVRGDRAAVIRLWEGNEHRLRSKLAGMAMFRPLEADYLAAKSAPPPAQPKPAPAAQAQPATQAAPAPAAEKGSVEKIAIPSTGDDTRDKMALYQNAQAAIKALKARGATSEEWQAWSQENRDALIRLKETMTSWWNALSRDVRRSFPAFEF